MGQIKGRLCAINNDCTDNCNCKWAEDLIKLIALHKSFAGVNEVSFHHKNNYLLYCEYPSILPYWYYLSGCLTIVKSTTQIIIMIK